MFAVDSVFWKRTLRVFKMGLGTPKQEPMLWLLLVLNLFCQICAGYVAQSHFYYTGTGTSSKDPGMVSRPRELEACGAAIAGWRTHVPPTYSCRRPAA
jgi:hypothetical protein